MSTLTTHQIPWCWPSSRPGASVPIIRELGNLRVLGLITQLKPICLEPCAQGQISRQNRKLSFYSSLPSSCPMCLLAGHIYTPHPTPEAHTFHTYSEVLSSFLRLWHVAWVLVLHPSFARSPPSFKICANCLAHPSWEFRLTTVLTTQTSSLS